MVKGKGKVDKIIIKVSKDSPSEITVVRSTHPVEIVRKEPKAESE